MRDKILPAIFILIQLLIMPENNFGSHQNQYNLDYLAITIKNVSIHEKTNVELLEEIVQIAMKEGAGKLGFKGIAFTSILNPEAKWSLKLKDVTLGTVLNYAGHLTASRCIDADGFVIFAPVEKLDYDVVLSAIEVNAAVRQVLDIKGDEDEDVLKIKLKKLHLQFNSESTVTLSSNGSMLLVKLPPTESELFHSLFTLINRGLTVQP